MTSNIFLNAFKQDNYASKCTFNLIDSNELICSYFMRVLLVSPSYFVPLLALFVKLLHKYLNIDKTTDQLICVHGLCPVPTLIHSCLGPD